MKAVIKHQANDGSEHGTEAKALERDRLLVVIEEITRACLKPVPTECGWNGYIQQHPASVTDYKRTLMRIAKQEGVYGKCGDSDCIWDLDPKLVHPRGPAGRYIDDGGSRPLNAAWHRLMCMDAQCREYNQPYFAMNPKKCEDGEVDSNGGPADGQK